MDVLGSFFEGLGEKCSGACWSLLLGFLFLMIFIPLFLKVSCFQAHVHALVFRVVLLTRRLWVQSLSLSDVVVGNHVAGNKSFWCWLSLSESRIKRENLAVLCPYSNYTILHSHVCSSTLLHCLALFSLCSPQNCVGGCNICAACCPLMPASLCMCAYECEWTVVQLP